VLEHFEIKISSPFQSIHSDIYKESTIVMFLSEGIFHHSIHGEERARSPFRFFRSRFILAVPTTEIANFHFMQFLLGNCPSI
jgi:DNA repair protein RecO (recombination protein O)